MSLIPSKKRKNNKTDKGRIIQGEKGIGRFAIHKLGESIELYTKAKGQNEVKLEMNFVDFNPDDINLFNQQTDYKLLDEVSNNWYVQDPPEKVTRESGTIIRIYNIREHWSENDYKELYKNIQRMMPPVDENAKKMGIEFIQDFSIEMYLEGKLYNDADVKTFADVFEAAQFTMMGTIDENGIMSFQYKSLSPIRVYTDSIDLLDDATLSLKNYSLETTECRQRCW